MIPLFTLLLLVIFAAPAIIFFVRYENIGLDILPPIRNKALSIFSLFFLAIGTVSVFVIIPIASNMVVADLDVGILYILSAIYFFITGFLILGYLSGDKWSLLIVMRSFVHSVSLQMPAMFSVTAVLLVAGTLRLSEVVSKQAASGWNIFHNPFLFLAGIVFIVSLFLIERKILIDIPETKSDLTEWFNMEPPGMKSILLVSVEYINVFIISAIAVSLFFGGWSVPFVDTEYFVLYARIPVQVGSFLIKTAILVLIGVQLRWTLPRFRIDQTVNLAWKVFLPLATINLVGVSCWLFFFRGKSLLEILTG